MKGNLLESQSGLKRIVTWNNPKSALSCIIRLKDV